jgi:hypothetical protein
MATPGLALMALTLTAHKPTHGHMAMTMAGKQKNEFWRELHEGHKGGCCCFEWTVYASWACYMPLRRQYNPKPPIWPLIAVPDLAGDQMEMGRERVDGFGFSTRNMRDALRALCLCLC